MAKINARGARQIGPTLFTERDRPADPPYDVERRYYEAWRLRSDGQVQTRIIKTTPVGNKGHVTKHSSAFRNVGRLGSIGATPSIDRLRAYLERKGFAIVKEQ